MSIKKTVQQILEGHGLSFRETFDISLDDAKAYLENYKDGAVDHPIFEEGSFVFINNHDDLLFWNSHKGEAEEWDWVSDIANIAKDNDGYNIYEEWTYRPRSIYIHDERDRQWWDEIKSYTPNKKLPYNK